jgi:hypothetical protein
LKLNYTNIKQLEETGTNFMRSQDKFVFDRSLKQLEKISHNTLGFKEMSKFESEVILEEYWSLVSGPIELFHETYSKRRKRKNLFVVFNTHYKGRQISTDPSLVQMMRLFENDYSDSLINRWVFAVIKSWEDLLKSKDNFEAVTKFIGYKFDTCPVKQKRTQLLKANKNLFLKRQGPQFFAQQVIDRKTSHSNLCKEVGIESGSYSYHSIVVEELFEFFLKTKRYDKVVEIIESIGQESGRFSRRTEKKMLSAFILHVEGKNLNEFKELAKSKGFKIIGDPSYRTKWTVWEGGSAANEIQMENARLVLNKWILTSFIDVFFQLLINDPKRKRYWLQKIPLISSVKIYGSKYVKYRLLQDDRIKPYVESRFKQIGSTGDNAGILLEMGGYEVIEFTDSGALYCYSKEKNRLPERPHSIADLKNTYMSMACSPGNNGDYSAIGYVLGNTHYLNSEGRIYHSGNWTGRIDLWIKNFVK